MMHDSHLNFFCHDLSVLFISDQAAQKMDNVFDQCGLINGTGYFLLHIVFWDWNLSLFYKTMLLSYVVVVGGLYHQNSIFCWYVRSQVRSQDELVILIEGKHIIYFLDMAIVNRSKKVTIYLTFGILIGDS